MVPAPGTDPRHLRVVVGRPKRRGAGLQISGGWQGVGCGIVQGDRDVVGDIDAADVRQDDETLAVWCHQQHVDVVYGVELGQARQGNFDRRGCPSSQKSSPWTGTRSREHGRGTVVRSGDGHGGVVGHGLVRRGARVSGCCFEPWREPGQRSGWRKQREQRPEHQGDGQEYSSPRQSHSPHHRRPPRAR